MNEVAQGGEAAALSLLRQLSIGLGVYRLYPGDPGWPLFVSAVERVRESAMAALARGPVEIEIRGKALRTHEGALPDDDLLGRLALACYERGAERLVVREPPGAYDLSLLYRVLTLPIEEVDRSEGRGPCFEHRVFLRSSSGSSDPLPRPPATGASPLSPANSSSSGIGFGTLQRWPRSCWRGEVAGARLPSLRESFVRWRRSPRCCRRRRVVRKNCTTGCRR